MKIYSGQSGHGVFVNSNPLSSFLHHHEPNRPFEWGESAKGTGGSRLLARSLLFDATGSEMTAKLHGHDFAIEVVSTLAPSWGLSQLWIEDWVKERYQVLASVQEQ